MTRYRLTRRGRLVLHALPVLLVAGTGLTVAADRLTPAGRPAPVVAGPAGAGREPAASARPKAPSPSPAVRRARAAKPRPKPAPKPTPSPAPRPTRPPYYGTGTLAAVPGSSAAHGSGSLRRFVVEVEAGLGIAPAAFAAQVERVLFDQRGWRGNGRLAFQRVPGGPVAFRVVLASPATTDRLCRPLRTGGIYSCYMNGRAVLNARRWFDGASVYPGDLAGYRVYMVNHEVGHALGHGHRFACGAGGLAPVMVQQTKGLRGCRKNPWPLADER